MSQRIEDILRDARTTKFHAGIKWSLYEKFKGRVNKNTRNTDERDRALKQLREIFDIR